MITDPLFPRAYEISVETILRRLFVSKDFHENNE